MHRFEKENAEAKCADCQRTNDVWCQECEACGLCGRDTRCTRPMTSAEQKREEGRKDFMEQKQLAFNVFTAAREGDLAQLRGLLGSVSAQHGLSLQQAATTFRDAHRRTVLHFAASYGRVEVVEYILSEVPTLKDERDEEQGTALSLAAQGGWVDVVTMLLDAGADLTLTTTTGATPLQMAVARGHDAVADLLLNRGANVNHGVDTVAGPALCAAAARGAVATLQRLLQAGADPDASGSNQATSLVVAAAAGHHACFRPLIDSGCNVAASVAGGTTALHICAETGHMEAIETLLSASADHVRAAAATENASGHLPVHLAAAGNHQRAVEVLLPLLGDRAPREDELRSAAESVAASAASPAADGAAEPSEPTVDVDAPLPDVSGLTAPTEEGRAQALEAKDRGNAAFKAKDFPTAIAEYTAAIELDPTDAAFYSNRSACFSARNDGEAAFRDARIARALRPDWSKAFFREGCALEVLSKFEQAAYIYWEGLKIDEDNRDLRKRFTQCVKKGRQEFLASQPTNQS